MPLRHVTLRGYITDLRLIDQYGGFLVINDTRVAIVAPAADRADQPVFLRNLRKEVNAAPVLADVDVTVEDVRDTTGRTRFAYTMRDIRLA